MQLAVAAALVTPVQLRGCFLHVEGGIARGSSYAAQRVPRERVRAPPVAAR